MQYRHEQKFEVGFRELAVLRQRLRLICPHDPHAPVDGYRVRSVYFDTPDDTALFDNRSGVSRREKFRIRCYNADERFLRLEKKNKLAGLGWKDEAQLTPDQVRKLLSGSCECLRDDPQPLVQELLSRMQTQLLRPKIIVDYHREAFVYPPGNVRITLDEDIRAGLHCADFLDPQALLLPLADAPAVLEVKWDGFLPSVIRSAVQLPECHTEAFSKYVLCRSYG